MQLKLEVPLNNTNVFNFEYAQNSAGTFLHCPLLELARTF